MSENRELKKYKQQSINFGLSPRCPIASANHCPRYFKTLSLLKKSELIAGLNGSLEEEIRAYWKKTLFWTLPLEEEPAVTKTEGEWRTIRNISPEIGYELFGIFACFLLNMLMRLTKG